MYAMCAAPAAPGSPDTVWHITSRNARHTLCGYSLRLIRPHSPAAGALLTERHCTACMAVFAAIIRSGLTTDHPGTARPQPGPETTTPATDTPTTLRTSPADDLVTD